MTDAKGTATGYADVVVRWAIYSLAAAVLVFLAMLILAGIHPW
jgi:hypothetical protein